MITIIRINLRNIILLGANILATPIMQQGATNISVTFPAPTGETESWYRVDDESWSVHTSESPLNIPADINTVRQRNV